MTKGKPYPLLMMGSLLTGAAAPLCSLLDNELGAAMMTASAWSLLPLVSFFLPLVCCRRGCQKYLAFFLPVLFAYLGWLLLRMPMPPLSAFISLLLGILGSTVGAELARQEIKKDHR